MTLTNTKQRGFTIVELLIVVVIIAILAAITIVAYNGIQNRAKKSAAVGAASTLQKKAEAYAIENTTYPTTVATLTGATTDKTWNLPTDAVVRVNPDATAAPAEAKTIMYYTCNSAKGYKIKYWNFEGTGLLEINGGDQSAGTCTIATT